MTTISNLQITAKEILSNVQQNENKFNDLMEDPTIKALYDRLNNDAYSEYIKNLVMQVASNIGEEAASIVKEKYFASERLDAVEKIGHDIAYQTITSNPKIASELILTEYLLFKSMSVLLELLVVWAREKVDPNYQPYDVYTMFQLFVPVECNPFSDNCTDYPDIELFDGILKEIGKYNSDNESISPTLLQHIYNSVDCFFTAIDQFKARFSNLGTSPDGLDYFHEYSIITRIGNNYAISSMQGFAVTMLTCQDTIPLFMHLLIKEMSRRISDDYLPTVAIDFEMYMYGKDGYTTKEEDLIEMVERYMPIAAETVDAQFIVPLNMNSDTFTTTTMLSYLENCRSVADDE